MSVEEMKLSAINEIYNLKSEQAVKEILDHLVKLKNAGKTPIDADTFFKIAADKYGDVLQKLAQ
jgi:hypothetical protein